MKIIGALLLAVALANISPVPAQAACQVSSGGSGFSYGASVNDATVTICAKAGSVSSSTSSKASKSTVSKSTSNSSSTQTVTKVTSVPTPVGTAKAGCPASTVSTADIIIAASLGCPIYGYATPPSASTKLVTTAKTNSVTSVVAKVANADVSFSPDAVSISASQQVADVFEAVILSSSATQHFRSGTLLGQAAEVRFTPQSQAWSFGDGSVATGAQLSHGFGAAGTYSVQLTVNYEVASRVAGDSNWVINGAIATSSEIVITVLRRSAQIGQPTQQTGVNAMPKPLLVSANCNVRPSNYRCTP